ncbi:FmdB family zinc ribbon protein [Streptomyces sp. NPDC088560]|uniref:FmdB family zinc ribbon protein n=1 Tax=Streptomyces sp. NPDC088560 TaxID=3365868 RepID=UPI00380671B4
MPTYQYQCTECGEGLEAVQKFTDDALTECPNCGGRLKKVFSAVGIVFKGSGFYRNDSRGSTSSSSPASKPSGSSSGTTSSSSDAKPSSSSSSSAKSSAA